MPKSIFTATDANGLVHKRTSENRTYSHTVVYRLVKSELMASANDARWAYQDGRNYDYYTKIATGNDPNPTVNYLAQNPHMHSAERIAEHEAYCIRHNAERVVDAKERVEGLSREQYVAKQLADRIAAVEARDFTEWHNAGWCGRYDLALKVAAKYTDVQILVATKQ